MSCWHRLAVPTQLPGLQAQRDGGVGVEVAPRPARSVRELGRARERRGIGHAPVHEPGLADRPRADTTRRHPSSGRRSPRGRRTRRCRTTSRCRPSWRRPRRARRGRHPGTAHAALTGTVAIKTLPFTNCGCASTPSVGVSVSSFFQRTCPLSCSSTIAPVGDVANTAPSPTLTPCGPMVNPTDADCHFTAPVARSIAVDDAAAVLHVDGVADDDDRGGQRSRRRHLPRPREPGDVAAVDGRPHRGTRVREVTTRLRPVRRRPRSSAPAPPPVMTRRGDDDRATRPRAPTT